jgi:hypothetical protein
MTTTFQINSKLGGELAITDNVQAAVRFVVPDVSDRIAVQLCTVLWVIWLLRPWLYFGSMYSNLLITNRISKTFLRFYYFFWLRLSITSEPSRSWCFERKELSGDSNYPIKSQSVDRLSSGITEGALLLWTNTRSGEFSSTFLNLYTLFLLAARKIALC